MRAPPGHLRFHFQSEAPSFESLLFFAGMRVGGQQRLPFDDPPPPLPDSGCNFDEPHEDSLASLLRLRNEAVHGRPRAGRLLLLAHRIANTATLRVALAWLGADAQRQDHAGNRTPRSSRGLRRLLVAWRLRSPHTRPADPVICTASGGAVQERNLRRALADAKTAAGLDATEGRLSLHSLRHSWASALATGGLAATTLARVTGHSDPGFTYRVYARDARDDATLVADVLNRAANAGFGG